MNTINKDWHLANKMPKNPTVDQRTTWHTEHAKHCTCRPMPDGFPNKMKKKNE